MTPDFATFNPSLPGKWVNDDIGYGYHLRNRRAVKGWLWCIRRAVSIVYDYHPDYRHPLFFEQQDGTRICPQFIDATDGGSVPPFARGLLPDDGILGYFPHDAAARDGGLFFRYPGETKWVWRQVTRWQSDKLLRNTAQCEPQGKVGPFLSKLVELSVRLAHYRFHEWTPNDDAPVWPESEGVE